MIEVTFDSHGFERQVGRLTTSEIPYACAVALTRTAQDAQKAVKANLGKKFILRNDWTERGIRMMPAKKKDWPDAFAVVGSIDLRMVESEEGGTRTRPIKGGAFVYPKGIRKSVRELVPRSKQPGALLRGGAKGSRGRGTKGRNRKPQAFLLKTDAYSGIFQRTQGRRLKLLYVLDSRPVHIGRRDWLVKTTEGIARRKFAGHFEKVLENI